MKTNYANLNETVYEEILANGLRVVLVPKPGFKKTYGLFSTNYGSIDEKFVPLGSTEPTTVPEGIAHFLEHKLFEKEDGDVFQKFSAMGASANAFTSFTKTSYLFAATEHIYDNLGVLLDFVQTPYFTPESVNKEKGIIGQEIQMYQDEPNWRLFYGLIKNLFPKHPLHIDIAGTVESIDQITADDLYLCYNTFYHPTNMALLVVGNFDPEEMLSYIVDNQSGKEFAEAPEIKRYLPEETAADITPSSEVVMDIVTPKLAMGYRSFAETPSDPLTQMRLKIAADFALAMLLGDSSENYLELYNDGLIDDSFGTEFNLERGFTFVDCSGDSEKPELLAECLEKIFATAAQSPEFTEENLARQKKQKLGKYLQALNSVEYIANTFFRGVGFVGNLFQVPEVIESVTLAEVKNFAATFFAKETQSKFFMYPLSNDHDEAAK